MFSLMSFFCVPAGDCMRRDLYWGLCADLAETGSPPNMGICVACIERDIAGALGLAEV